MNATATLVQTLTATRCPTCRQDVEHLVALSRVITHHRIAVFAHPRLLRDLKTHRAARLKAHERYAAHLLEHRAEQKEAA